MTRLQPLDERGAPPDLLPLARVLQASINATAARRQLEEEIDATLLGVQDDPDALDAAILQQRQAQRVMLNALHGWGRWRQKQHSTHPEEVTQRAA